MLYRIIKKNQNKIFWTIGQFEFEYFGSSDVVNKLIGNLQQFYKNVPIFRFESYVFEKGLWPPNPSYEQTNIFLMSCAAATIGAIVFSKGAPYRKPLYTNGIQFIQLINNWYFVTKIVELL